LRGFVFGCANIKKMFVGVLNVIYSPIGHHCYGLIGSGLLLRLQSEFVWSYLSTTWSTKNDPEKFS
jgi:hypothetical protein